MYVSARMHAHAHIPESSHQIFLAHRKTTLMLLLAYCQGFKPSDHFKTYAAIVITLTIEQKLYFLGEKLHSIKKFYTNVLVRMNALSGIQAYKSVI